MRYGSKQLAVFVLAVDLAALGMLLTPVPARASAAPGALVVLSALALVAGAHPVRFRDGSTAMTVTHPIVIASLALMGALPAVLVSLVGVVGAWLGARRIPDPMKVAFNVGAVPVATMSAAWAFQLGGGVPGAAVESLLWPLLAATTAYFAVNTGLVSLVVALSEGRAPLSVWMASFRWATVSYFTGFSVAAGVVLLVRGVGLWGLALAVPPCWLLVAFYRSHQARLDEKQRRIDQVERLNGELEQTVAELKQAMEHVQQLQGLLPICMHCKSIRDDQNTWHRLESYISDHSEIRFTHSLCECCQRKHYPGRVRPAKTG